MGAMTDRPMTDMPSGASVTVPADEAVALPMPLHHMVWPEEEARPRFTCTADVGSKCRLVCNEDCGAEQWPCGRWDYDLDQERAEAHPMRDDGECHVVLFLDMDEHDYADRYTGRIKVRWEGDSYSWEPAAADLAARTLAAIDAQEEHAPGAFLGLLASYARERVASDLAGLQDHQPDEAEARYCASHADVNGQAHCKRRDCADARRYSDGLRRTAALYGVTP